jgi:hypothetical protein
MSIEHGAKGIEKKPWGARGKSLTDVLQNANCKVKNANLFRKTIQLSICNLIFAICILQ